MGNLNLHAAKSAQNDEFYTRYVDVDAELRYYAHHFWGKVILCNCDNPDTSQFVKYFRIHKERLGIRELLISHLRADGTGDFRGKEALAMQERADIVITNPPFSLFRQYMAQLVGNPIDNAPLFGAIEPREDTKFLIVGGTNAMSYNSIFPLLRERRIWTGMNTGAKWFDCPNGKEKEVQVVWYTNLEHPNSKSRYDLTVDYDPALHPRYHNYEAIECKYLKDIPRDYDGVIGVPITFMNGYNPDQFEIVGLLKGTSGYGTEPTLRYKNVKQVNKDGSITLGTLIDDVAMTWHAERPADTTCYTADGIDGYMVAKYSRVLIRRAGA